MMLNYRGRNVGGRAPLEREEGGAHGWCVWFFEMIILAGKKLGGAGRLGVSL